MKIVIFLLMIVGLSNCSFNNNSEFWTEDSKIANENSEVLINKIKQKSSNIMSLTEEEFKIFLEDYAKKSKYPNISK